jgi:hypothetical protein
MIYTFKHPKQNKFIDVAFEAKRFKKVYGSKDPQLPEEEISYVDDEGVKWERVFYSPQTSVDTKIDPNDSNKFVEKTKGKGTMGDLWDRSSELSEKREKIYGKDPVQEKYLRDYSKKRKGKSHPKLGKSTTFTI